MMTEKNTPQKKQANANLNIKDFLNIALANWVWFLLSVIVCVGISYYKLKKSPNIYYRSASVLIKDQGSGTRTADASSAFYEVSTLRMNNSIQNEILIFKSKRLMMEVARKLDLDVYYSQEGKFRDWDLYNECPVKLSFPEARENATFSFKVTPFSAKEVWLSDFSTPTWTGGKIKATLNDTLQTPIGKVVVTPSLFYSKDCFGTPYTVTKANLESTALRYNAALQATIMNDNNSSMISLGISDVSPRRAEDILNTLIDVYNQDAIDDKNRMSVNTANFINERLIIIEQELGGVESQIADFKRQNRFTDFATQTGTYVEASNKYQEEGVALEGELTLTRYIRDYLMDPSKSNELLPSNTGISDVNIEGQISQYNALMLQRDKLLANSSTKNPVVMDINNSLSAMKQTMIRTVDNAIAALNMKISNIRGEEERALRRIAAVPSQQKYVLSVERQQKIKESLYIYLLNKREENALTQSMAENNARVIDPATGSNAPISPNAQQILLIGLVVGLAIPAGILILINLLDTRIRTKKDLEDNLSIPFLGEIPQHAREKEEKRKAIVVKEDGKDSVSEAFRILRTNMAFMNTSDHRMQSIMVTSLNVGAGKTFISSNLAMTLALAGKKVVLVDLDIRKGTLSAKMDKKKEGVTNFLAGNITNLDSIIYPSELHQNLSIIYNGPVPPNPAELLLSPHLNDLVNRLKERFDYVLLDNVPSNMVADAMIVNRVADLTVYVVRAGNMDKRQLPEVERLYTEGKLKNMAVVLNGVKTYKSGYGYYGYYGYGYGYGYGEGKKKKKRKLF